MKKIYIIHSTTFDFANELYVPLRRIDDFEFVFPHEKENELKNSKELIAGCDIVLAEVSYPSTGSGIELGRAEALDIPIVAIFKKGFKVFSSIKFLTEDVVEYEDIEKDFEKIKGIINSRLK